MNQYPIILIPSALTQAQSALPPTPKFNEPYPIAPDSEPQPINMERIGWELFWLHILTVLLSLITNNYIIGFGFWLFGMIGAVFVVIDEQNFYTKRHSSWRNQVKTYDQKITLYKERERAHDLLIKQTCLTPEKIQIYRVEQVRDLLRGTISHNGSNSSAQRGQMEAKFYKDLVRYFPSRIHTGLTLTIPNFPHPYTADFAYIDKNWHLYIDIEIDEPYVYYTKEPSHYIESWRDNRRNQFFLNRRWLVIRFAEEQVAKWPSRCCQVVASTIKQITGEEVAVELTSEPPLPPVECWTQEEAEEMAANNFRNTYLTQEREIINLAEVFMGQFTTNQQTKVNNSAIPISSSYSSSQAVQSNSSLSICPYCQVKVKPTNLASHKANKCPKRPGRY